jgi:hypothetical protein
MEADRNFSESKSRLLSAKLLGVTKAFSPPGATLEATLPNILSES